jgi:DNA-binding transcriptional MocR family regulator
MSSAEPLLYERVAGLVAGKISSGALRVSERIPSVRSMSRSARVTSDRRAGVRASRVAGLDERPQSGYFVRALRDRLPEPLPRQPPLPRRAASRPTYSTPVEAMQRTDLVQLNMACAQRSPRQPRPLRDELRDHPNHAGETCRRAIRAGGRSRVAPRELRPTPTTS